MAYITAAFKAHNENEAYIFFRNTYVVVDYCPGTGIDRILSGPTILTEGFPCLKNTIIGDLGVDCAFASHDKGKAYLFSCDFCALLDYSSDAKLEKGPMPIAQMFPFLSGTIFENGLDAAFESDIESSRYRRAFIFRGDQYAHITYDRSNDAYMYDCSILKQGPIAESFRCLKGTGFECYIGAAFASHRTNEAYLFKGDDYLLFHFTPGKNDDEILGDGVHKIKDNWPGVAKLLP